MSKKRFKIVKSQHGASGISVHTDRPWEDKQRFSVYYSRWDDKKATSLDIRVGRGRLELNGRQARSLWHVLNTWHEHKDVWGDRFGLPSKVRDVLYNGNNYSNGLSVVLQKRSTGVYTANKLPLYTRLTVGRVNMTLNGPETLTIWRVLNKVYGKGK